MAYGTKYFANYRSGEKIRTVQLQLDGYAGPATEWFCSTEAPEDDQGDASGIFDEEVVSKVVRFEFMFDQHYDLKEFVAEPRTFKAVILEDAEIIFEGYMEQYDTYRPYQRPNYFVSLTATCGLNRLSKNKFEQTEFNEANLMLNYFEILQKCLNTIGIDRTLKVSCHVYMGSSPSAPNPLLSVETDIFRYFEGGRWMDAQTVVIDILNHFNAQLLLDKNAWVVRSSIDHSLGYTGYIEYPAGGGQTIYPEWTNIIRDINVENLVDPNENEQGATLQGGQVAIIPRIRKWSVEADLGGTKEQFTNGGLQLWTVDGPVGWETNMPAALGGFGWTKVETGMEGSPFALSIRGRAPHPYFKLVKKGIWPLRKTVVVPIEPAIWWESPEIEIKATDESLNIGFEYYTDEDSAGFFYAVTLYRSQPVEGQINRAFVKTGSEGFPYNDEFTMLLAPAHPKINPETGIAQSKGRVEYNLDLNTLNSKYLAKPDQPFFDRAEIWFYYSNNDSTKTGDEYWIYNMIGQKTVKAEFQVPDGDSKYKVVVESNPFESDEGDSIKLITGDYSPGFLGTTMKMGAMSLIPTGGWRRRGNNESMSIYRAVTVDRLAITYEVGDVITADIRMFDQEEIRYIHLLRFLDRDPNRLYKIVRYKFNHYKRIASVRCVEITHNEPPLIKQRSYTDARGLLDEDTNGDVVYPSAGSASGRIGADDEDVFGEPEPTEEQIANGRIGVFEDVPPLIYTVNERSTSQVHLREYLSVGFLESEQGVEGEEIEEEDQFDPEDFVLSVVSMPSWVESVEIDKLSVYVTAKPTAIGNYSLTLSVINDAFGAVPNVVVPVIVYPPIKLKYTLRDTSGLEPVDVAEIFNGAGFEKPEFDFDVKVTVTGRHDGWYGKLTTPDGPIQVSVDPYTLVEGVDQATYILGENVVAQIGFNQIDFGVYRNEGEADNLRRVKYERIKFSFYDEETLAKAKFFLRGAESGELIGPIKPDGSSAFENVKEAWDVEMVITGVEHDSGVSVLGSEVGDLDTKEIIIPEVVADATYLQFGEVRTEFDPSTYNVLLTLYLADPVTGEKEIVYIRAISFTINHKPIQPTSGVLELGSVPDNTSNFDFIMELEGTGNSVALPEDRWTVRNKATSAPFNSDEWVLYRFLGDQLVSIDISAYTGNPQVNTYSADGITQVESRLFGLLGSKNIGNPNIHKTPSTFRVINRRRMDGTIVAVYQADFSFGPAVVIDDDAPVGGPATGTGGIILKPGLGISITVDDEYNTVNVLANPDHFEFDNDPLAAKMNIKAKAVQLTHLADLPSLSVIGNMTGATGPAAAVGVITSTTLAGASHSNFGSLLAIKTYIDNALTTVISGTVGYFAKFLTATSLGVGILSENGISVTANGGQFVSAIAPNANPRGFLLSNASAVVRWNLSKFGLEPGDNSGSDFGLARFNDAGQFLGNAIVVSRLTGNTTLIGPVTVTGSGVVISTTSTTLNPNFNADLLDGEHGTYYLSRTNHTGTQLAATISDFAAAVRAVPLTGLVTTTNSAILATDSILIAFGKLQAQISGALTSIGTGSINYFPYYNTATSFATSPLSINSASITAWSHQFQTDIAQNSNVRGLVMSAGGFNRWSFGKAGLETGGDAGADLTAWAFTDMGIFKGEAFRISRETLLMTINGTLTITGSGVVISTTSTTLNPNFNADLLDGQHGTYYLSRANHTGTQLAATISDFAAAVRAVPLTGLTITTGSAVVATDTILQAFGKLQGQINSTVGSIGTGTVNYFPYYNTTTSFATSILSTSAGAVIVNNGVYVVDIAQNANVRGITLQTGSSNRWSFGKAGLETGSDAGSDFTLWAYNDTAVFLREALRISRATGNATFSGTISATGGGSTNWNTAFSWGNHAGLYSLLGHTHTIANVTGLQTALDAKLSGSGSTNYIPKYTGSLTLGNSVMYESAGSIVVAGQIFSDLAHNANVRGIGFQSGGSNRWTVGKAGSEGGADSGSDLVAWSYNDAGSFLREAFRISRANGNMTLAGSLTVSGGNSNNWNTAFSWGNHAGLYAAASHTHPISQITSLQSTLDGKVGNWGNGVADRFALWVNSSSIGNSNLYYSGGNIGVGMSPGYQFDVNGSIRYNNQLASTVGNGTKPIDVTSSTLCTNLNADLLDGNHASAFASASHTHTSAQITDFTSAARGTISGTGSISYNSSTGQISYTGSAGLSGSGTSGYFAVWTGSSSLGSNVIRDTGTEINISSGRSVGIEGPMAARNYLHVWGYQSNGTASNHGTLILHNLASATINGSAAIEILSTTRGFLNARMTRAQRLSLSPTDGLQVYQTDTVGLSPAGLKIYIAGQWQHVMSDPAYA